MIINTMKKKYNTPAEQKEARKVWNKRYYEKRKKLMQFALRTMELEKLKKNIEPIKPNKNI